MKSISSSIIVLSGSIMLSTAGIVRTDVSLLLGFAGLLLALLGITAWWWAMAIEETDPKKP